MSAEDYQDHLSRIKTIWTDVAAAHGEESSAINNAQQRIIDRYSGAVYRYLLSALRNRDAADEVYQEFALRLMKGGFRHADKERGRFRDYLKTAVLRLITDYYRRKKRRDPLVQAANVDDKMDVAAAEHDPADDFDSTFLTSCRDEFLSRAWAGLKLVEETHGQPLYSVLDYRARVPKATSEQMAAELTEQLQPSSPYTPAGIRKTLQRAREKFSELLVYEVSQSLSSPGRDDLEAELIELELLPYCQSALSKRAGNADDPGG